jgi:hypothetical protein
VRQHAAAHGLCSSAADVISKATADSSTPHPATPMAATPLFLHRDAYLCQTEDGAVLMNVRTEKYFGLPHAHVAAIRTRVADWPFTQGEAGQALPVTADETADLLLQSGLLTAVPNEGKPAHMTVVKVTDAIPFKGTIADPPRPSIQHIWAFLTAIARAKLDLKRTSLVDTMARVQKRKAQVVEAPIDHAKLLHLVRIYRLLTAFAYTATDFCLFDSLALVEFLARCDVFPTWVIGVRTRPFAAHSWVQQGDLILNDQLERIQEYSPLMSV